MKNTRCFIALYHQQISEIRALFLPSARKCLCVRSKSKTKRNDAGQCNDAARAHPPDDERSARASGGTTPPGTGKSAASWAPPSAAADEYLQPCVHWHDHVCLLFKWATAVWGPCGHYYVQLRAPSALSACASPASRLPKLIVGERNGLHRIQHSIPVLVF